jgi:ribonuclease VapC
VIAIDSSAIVAIVLREPEGSAFARIIAENDCILGAPTLFESTIVLGMRTAGWHLPELQRVVALKNLAVVEFTGQHAEMAQIAYERFGKGASHPARLNFGDCMAYAIARIASVPLLYKGGDFPHTDIVPAYSP